MEQACRFLKALHGLGAKDKLINFKDFLSNHTTIVETQDLLDRSYFNFTLVSIGFQEEGIAGFETIKAVINEKMNAAILKEHPQQTLNHPLLSKAQVSDELQRELTTCMLEKIRLLNAQIDLGLKLEAYQTMAEINKPNLIEGDLINWRENPAELIQRASYKMAAWQVEEDQPEMRDTLAQQA